MEEHYEKCFNCGAVLRGQEICPVCRAQICEPYSNVSHAIKCTVVKNDVKLREEKPPKTKPISALPVAIILALELVLIFVLYAVLKYFVGN